MKTVLVAALLCLPLAALAGPPEAPEGPGRAERRMRLMQLVGLADALELSDAETLKLAEKIRSFDERRRPLREEMAQSMKTLRAAAEGDAAALAKVDASIQRLLDNRAKMAALDKEMFNAISRDLPPQKRARLALYLARFHDEVRGMGGRGKGFRGPRRPFGP